MISKRGVLLFAFNIEHVNYYEMAVATAKRVNHFLNLPVTLVTNSQSLPKDHHYNFDNVIIAPEDKTNKKGKKLWLNKGRYRAYDFTPYDETILLDTDYLINSDRLTQLFDLYDDFMCAYNVSFLMSDADEQEVISTYSFPTMWATVLIFRKTPRVKQIFECLEMVQKNYSHYSSLYHFQEGLFRNDYAITIALRIVNGNTVNKKDYIPWNLVHLGKEAIAHRVNDTPFNTEYMLLNNDERRKYILIKDTDFHMMSKGNFMEIVDE
jgi:hypothetical protein